jgi:hypothetical protein
MSDTESVASDGVHSVGEGGEGLGLHEEHGDGSRIDERVGSSVRLAQEAVTGREDGGLHLHALVVAAAAIGCVCAETPASVPGGGRASGVWPASSAGAMGQWRAGSEPIAEMLDFVDATAASDEEEGVGEGDVLLSASVLEPVPQPKRLPHLDEEIGEEEFDAIRAALQHLRAMPALLEGHLEEALFDVCPVALSLVGSEEAVTELQAMVASHRGGSLRGAFRRGSSRRS